MGRFGVIGVRSPETFRNVADDTNLIFRRLSSALFSAELAFVYGCGDLFKDSPATIPLCKQSLTDDCLVFDTSTPRFVNFDVDDIRFGVGAQVIAPSAPEPSTWAMMGLSFAAIGLAGYRARGKGQATVA